MRTTPRGRLAGLITCLAWHAHWATCRHERILTPCTVIMPPARHTRSPSLPSCAIHRTMYNATRAAAAQVVCRAWRQAAREDAVVRACFARHWGVAGFTGSPRQPSFLHTATLASFVKRHEVERGDSLQALAVRHGVHPAAIKRQNALMSEHSIFSRHFLYIPVVDRAELAGKVGVRQQDGCGQGVASGWSCLG